MTFAAVDGEATADGRYILLGCSDGKAIENPKGLSTLECLRFLVGRPYRHLWGFAFDYDTNQILNGLDVSQLSILAYRNRCYFGDYRIVHLPGKMLRITDREQGRTVTVWDAYSFIRSSFARWLRDWKICSHEDIEFIEGMKEGRADFSLDQLDDIRRYNQMELRLLARAVMMLLERIKASGYKPASFHSPGSVSAAVMKVYKVRDHKGLNTPAPITAAAKAAYYGGRFETRYLGKLRGPLYHYDINSAYPAAASRLPCLACGGWRPARKIDLDEPDNLVFVTWEAKKPFRRPQDRPPFGPFPVRLPSGSLRYPLVNRSGGWYWSQEANAARALTNLHVRGGFHFERGCDHEPFAFLPAFYELRQELKRRGDHAEYTYKLILNSCYGKLAQHPRSETDEPRYYEPAWAGNITATTRAKLLAAIALDPSAIIQTATDGLTSLRELPLPLSSSLGEWDLKMLDVLLIVQSGVYFWKEKGGKTIQRSRGFHPTSLTFRHCEQHLRQHPGKTLSLANRRFVGYRTALHRNRLDLWRTWYEYDARLETSPEPRRELLERVNGYSVSVPVVRAVELLTDQVVDPFELLSAWELEQPDGPEGDTL